MKEHMTLMNNFIYSIFLFLIVFNPPIYAGFSFSVLAVLLSTLYLLSNTKQLKILVNVKSIHLTIRSFIIFFIYYTTVALFDYSLNFNEKILLNFFDNFKSYLSFFIVSLSIVIWAIIKEISFERMCKLYIGAGFIQTVLVVLCLISPSIKSFFNSLTMLNSNSEKITRGLEMESAYRNFGFASSLYDIFGFTMALLGIMVISWALKEKKIYIILSLLFAAAASVNARSSFFIYCVGFIIMLLTPQKRINTYWLFKLVVFSFVFAFFVSYVFSWIIGDSASEQLVWMASAITEVQSLFTGKSEGYFDALLNSFIIFPEGIDLLFGTAMPPHMAINQNSDIGYIQNIWQYGIIGSILLYIFYIRLFKIAINSLHWPYKIMMRSMLVMVIMYLVKLTCFGYSQASVIFGPLCFLSAYYSHYEKEKLY